MKFTQGQKVVLVTDKYKHVPEGATGEVLWTLDKGDKKDYTVDMYHRRTIDVKQDEIKHYKD